MKIRSLLFVPGDSERKFQRALTSAADALILDLEDSVAADQKEGARQTVRASLESDRNGKKLFVRVNALDTGLTLGDLAAVVPTALLTRSMSFSKMAWRATVASLVAAAVCVALLFMGYGIWALAADTDGIDGGSGASDDPAGAIVTPDTLNRAMERGLDPKQMLDRHDSGTFFGELGDLVKTGPSYTNVNDFRVILVGTPEPASPDSPPENP